MSVKFEKTWWWVIGAVILVAVIGVAVFLNFNFNNNSTDTSSIDIDNGDTKIDWDAYPSYTIKLTGSYNITAPGTYYLSGEISDGGISIKVADNAVVRLVLENVTIKNSSGPAIACYEGDDLVIELKGENYLEDGTKYASSYDEDVNGVIYSKADLTLEGDGRLTVKANYNDGIVSKDDLKINGGIYNIVAKDDGIRGKDSVYIVDGDITVEAKGDGIKSTNETEITKGFVLIAGGKINIAKSYEGLEARQIIIDGGVISILANDDGINAGTKEDAYISINGGEIYVNAAGDGIDSNGYIYFNGGTTLVDGPTNSGNGALDAGVQIIQNGGVVIAAGASGMAENLGASSAIYNVGIFFSLTLPANTEISIKSSDGVEVINYTSAKTFSHLAAGTPQFKKGETYNIYVDGEKYDSFTISDIVTTVGQNTAIPGGGLQPGGGGPRR
ncbi:MAG: carbohydrate-binding domain-containing protein [Candidatus Saccharibacteria bacterium]|nr:carbohydrate-binding domain-containing protein [Candidatus Saccharibacteria bacterium]